MDEILPARLSSTLQMTKPKGAWFDPESITPRDLSVQVAQLMYALIAKHLILDGDFEGLKRGIYINRVSAKWNYRLGTELPAFTNGSSTIVISRWKLGMYSESLSDLQQLQPVKPFSNYPHIVDE